ncbi:MAG TPA: carbon-nitrogen hydrolase family protein [Propionibacteriaceae bacterium]|jgi:predicted amidohydrolase|nr:carbon-nitrogen hydrolase family protein [Propionibacteriaceae bacterium]
MTTLRVALAQIASGDDPAVNLDQVEAKVSEAAAAGAELVVFPEATMRRFGPGLRRVAEPLDGPWATRLAELARSSAVTVVAGMFTPADASRVRNTLVAAGPDGTTHYDKIHLFDAFGFAESDTVAAGNDPVVITVSGVPVGLTTCYDVRFPGLYTRLAEQGAAVVCVAASWAAGPGKIDQWQLLTRARALDSTTFVLAVGQADPTTVGLEPAPGAPAGVGHSAAVSPRGEVLVALGPEPDLLVVDLDLDEVTAARSAIPVLANRRF